MCESGSGNAGSGRVDKWSRGQHNLALAHVLSFTIAARQSIWLDGFRRVFVFIFAFAFVTDGEANAHHEPGRPRRASWPHQQAAG